MSTTTTTGTQPAAGHNSDARKQAWLDECRTFGEMAGAGDTSLLGWMQGIVQRAYRDEIELEWAEEGTTAYQEAKRARNAMLGKKQKANDGKADKVRISECRKMIRLGKLAVIRPVDNGGLGVFNHALKVVGDSVHIKGETCKLVLKVATEQLRRPDTPMSEDDIKSVLADKESADKGEGEYLNAAKKQIELAVKASGYDAHKRAAVTSITARMDEIHFKTAAQRLAEEKAQKKLAKQKASKKKKREGWGWGARAPLLTDGP